MMVLPSREIVSVTVSPGVPDCRAVRMRSGSPLAGTPFTAISLSPAVSPAVWAAEPGTTPATEVVALMVGTPIQKITAKIAIARRMLTAGPAAMVATFFQVAEAL